MALTVTHAYTSTTPPGPTDGLPGGKVGPNEWNAQHVVSGSIVANPGVSPKDFGAFGDGNSHPITLTDIANNPQWKGPFNQSPLVTYPVGTEWDTVGIQEAIYSAFASASTPGNVVWNAINGNTNSKFFVPAGSYLLNSMVWFAAEGFEVEFEDRENTNWQWNGYATFTCNSHSSTTLDGISATDIAQLWVGQYVFDATEQTGVGSIPGNTYISAINVSGGSVTLSNATTSTVTGLVVQPQSAAFYCDSAAYGTFKKVTLFCNVPITKAAGNFGNGSSNNAVWVIDSSGTVNMLSPQQLTLDSCIIFGQTRADQGLNIAPSGGGAQGDTILYLNCFISNCIYSGVAITGNNALSNQFINGDIQGCFRYGIFCSSGSFYVNGTSFQADQNDLNFSPQLGQIPYASADCFLGPGAGATSSGDLANVRSEASLGVITQNDASVYNYALAGADCSDWFSNFPFQLLTCIDPGNNNSKARSFCCVDAGGPNVWYQANVTTSSSDKIVVAGTSPDWTTNQWAGYSILFRFGSNGFTEHFTGEVTSNTTNTVTVAGEDLGDNVSADTLFFIAGQTSNAAPNFDSASAGNFFLGNPGGIQGWSLTAGSSVAQFTSGVTTPSSGDYVVIPDGDLFGVYNGNLPQFRIPLVAEVTGVSSGNATLSRKALYTINFGTGYSGTPITDSSSGSVGTVKWLQMPITPFSGCAPVIKGLGADSTMYTVVPASNLTFPNLPTSNPHVQGQIWANSNVISVSTG